MGLQLGAAAEAYAKRISFFRDHAGYSYGPGETESQGRERCARALAEAELEARMRGWWLDVQPDGESYAWQKSGRGECFDVVTSKSRYKDDADVFCGYYVTLRDENGEMLANVGGVTFADDNTYEPYRHVLFAELASEALHDKTTVAA